MIPCRSNQQHHHNIFNTRQNAYDSADFCNGRNSSAPLRSVVADDAGKERCSQQQNSDVVGMTDIMERTGVYTSAEREMNCSERFLPGDNIIPVLGMSEVTTVCPQFIATPTIATPNTPNSSCFNAATSCLETSPLLSSSFSASPSVCEDEKSLGHSAAVFESDGEKDDDCVSLKSADKTQLKAPYLIKTAPGSIAAIELALLKNSKEDEHTQSDRACSLGKDSESALEENGVYGTWNLGTSRLKAVHLRHMAHKYALEVVRQRYGGRIIDELSK
ncbi:metacyclin II, putative [Trypanosoma cruzi marinkellei]|uniref:Metacyclin II, putative n=1 Tax=Trypanosoma cruzi marinkellei TaxID=85056 RepID=K2NNR4_TRYCR|nr:metacyclin II, putative [Trypanosoma cruzi marinkellei]